MAKHPQRYSAQCEHQRTAYYTLTKAGERRWMRLCIFLSYTPCFCQHVNDAQTCPAFLDMEDVKK